MANNDLNLEYGVKFDVKTGGDTATTDIEKYSKEWQNFLNEHKLQIKMGINAGDYDITQQIEKQTKKAKQAADQTGELSVKEKELEKITKQLEQTIAKLELALEGETKELLNYKNQLAAANKELNESIAADNAKAGSIDKVRKSLKENLSVLEGMNKSERASSTGTALIETIKKQRAEIALFEKSIKSTSDATEAANKKALAAKDKEIAKSKELAATEEKLRVAQLARQITIDNSKTVKSALTYQNTGEVYSLKEGSIDEVQNKITRLTESVRIFNQAAAKVGFDDERLNGATRKATVELGRLNQKLATLQSGFGNRSLNSLLQINPKSIQETNALMAELARRRDALNRTDPGYANSLTAINKRQAELSAENARALGISQQKEKAINAETAAFAKQSTVISNLRNMAATYLSLYEGARLIGNIAKITGEFELQEKSLGAIIQSAEKAHELFGQIKALAVISPFTFKDLLSYTKQLAAYRVETDQLYETTKKLADVSAGLGVDMNRIILAYGQVQAASVLRGQELRQFTEAGIPLVSLLADKFTELEGRVVSTGEVFTKIGERLVPFEMIKGIFADMTNEGGMFFNMQEIQADTLAGKISNLKDSYQIMFASIGESGFINNVLKGTIDLVTKLARNWETVASVMVPLTAGLGTYKAGLLIMSGIEAARIGIHKMTIAAQTVQIGLTNKEIAAIDRKSASQMAALLSSRAQIVTDNLIALAATRNVALTEKDIALRTIKLAVIRAGTDATKLANLQEEIRSMLVKKGMSEDTAAAASRLALARATVLASDATLTFGQTLKTLFSSVSKGTWWLVLITALISVIAYFVTAANKANALNKEIAKIGSGGLDESAKLVGKFKQLSETARDTTKTLKEQSDALSTLKQVYGDILPDYMLTIEGLTAIGDKYNDVTTAIYANIAAKTKEKQINAVTENYTEKVNPILDGIKKDLQDMNVDALLAGKAINELQKRLNEGNVVDPYRELLKILKEINGTETKLSSESILENINISQIKSGAEKLKETLLEQKKIIESLDSKTTFFGSFDKQAKELDVEIKKATDNVIKGQKQVAGKITFFDESIYQFNERKADAQRVKLIDFINKVKADAANAIQNNDNALALGMTNWIEGATKKLANLNVNPIAENVNKLLERVSQSQGVGASQYNTLAYSGDNKEDYLKDLESKYTAVKEKIEQVNRANKDFRSGIKAGIQGEGAGFERELTKDELLNGYTNSANVRQKGLKQELDAINTIRAAYGLVDKEKNERTSTVNPRIAAIENEIALVEQAKKKYEELLKAGKSPEQAKTIVDDLYKDQFKLKDEKRKVLFQPVFNEKGWIESLKVGKEELKKIPKTEQPVFKVNLKINESEIKIFTDDTKAVLDKIEKEFNTSKKRIDLFKNIFDATGDSSLSKKIAESIEGAGTTDIETALNEAFRKSFEAIDIKPMFDKLGNVDIAASQSEINKLDPKSDSRVQAQKQLDVLKEFKAKEYVELLKGLTDFEGYEQKRTKIVRDGEIERANYRKSNLPQDIIDAKVAASTKKQEEDLTKLDLGQFKGSATWAKAFGDLDKVSKPTLERLKKEMKAFKEQAEKDGLPITEIEALSKQFEELENKTANFDLIGLIKTLTTDYKIPELTEKLKKLREELEAVKKLNDENVAKAANSDAIVIAATKANDVTKSDLNPEGTLVNDVTEAIKAQTIAYNNLAKSKALLAKLTEKEKKDSKDLVEAENAKIKSFSDFTKFAKRNTDDLQSISSAVSGAVSAFYDLADSMGITINPKTKAIIDDIVKGFGAVVAILSAIVAVMIVLNTVAAPLLIVAAALIAIVAIFAIIKAVKLNPINDQLKEQEAIVKSLEEQYAKLERSMERVLGTEWIEAYNKELTNLSQQVASLSEQIRLEKSKGKDADQTKIDELNKQVDETSNKIEDAGKKLQNFVVGTDLTSAATDFANSWLDAYKSFGSTTEAMKTKFRDMISSMVVNTLLAKAMEIALKPIFTAMEKAAETTSESGSAYSYAEIANIIAETTKSTANADANLKKIMDGLKSAGVDIKDGGSNLTGLSRGIQGVSEDTALLLGGYLDSIRFRLFAYFDAMDAANKFDLAGSIAQLMIAQNSQITHLEGIKANTLRTAVACEVLTGEIQSVKALSTNGSGYALKVNI